MKQFSQLIRFEILLLYRELSEWLNPIFFLVLVMMMFPLAIGSEPEVLQQLAPGAIWISITLSVLLSLDNLFRRDKEEGMLGLWCTSVQSMVIFVLARTGVVCLGVWMAFAFVLPLAVIFYGLSWNVLFVLYLSALFTVPTLVLLGAIGVALTISLPRTGILVALLVMPLYIPILLFATGAVSAALSSVSYVTQLAILAAFCVLSITFLPFLIAYLLEIQE